MMEKKSDIEKPNSAGLPAEFDAQTYHDLSVAARLRDIKLIKSEYSIKPEVFDALDELNNFGFFGEPSGFHFDSERGLILGHYMWTSEVKLGRKKVLKFVSEYLIAYTGLENFDADHTRFFFEKVGRFATYPYFRAEFSQHCASSGIMLPPLPSLNERMN